MKLSHYYKILFLQRLQGNSHFSSILPALVQPYITFIFTVFTFRSLLAM